MIQESPTLDLAKECSRFVFQYFEIIDASSTHIYHSALVMTPKTSMIRELYGSLIQPFTRVVHGVPSSWDLHAAVATRPFTTGLAVWSPCSRFIAVLRSDSTVVDILDAATLQCLQSLEVARGANARPRALIFSPDGRMLSSSGFDGWGGLLVSTWDLQTGGTASRVELPWRGPGSVYGDYYITYSSNGKMVGVLHCFSATAIISVVDVVSGKHTHDIHPCTPCTYDVWTHEESLRFATAEGAAITIWEVAFTPGATCTEIETLSVPDGVNQAEAFDREGRRTQFFPIPRRLAFTRASPASADELVVWGPGNSVSLVHDTSASWHPRMTFSSDGRFFACSTTGLEVCLWKETSTGYVLIGKLTSSSRCSIPLLSPNGESIITFGGSSIQLWHTKGFSTPSIAPAQVPHHTEDFVLEFVPGRQLAVVAREKEKTVAVIDLKSGLPQLTIDTPMEVYGFRVIENTVVVIGDGSIVTWNLPEGNPPLNARVGVEDSTRIAHFSDKQQPDTIAGPAVLDPHHIPLILPNSRYPGGHSVSIYCPSTGHRIHPTRGVVGTSVWLSPGEGRVWCAARNQVEWLTIIETRRGPQWQYQMGNIDQVSFAFPWRSSSGYKATDDGWLMDSDGRRLFMLPTPWRSHAAQRVWNDHFLALLHGELPQPVILDFAP